MEACQGRARFQQHRDASCHQVLFPFQGKAPKEIHTILTETLTCFLPCRAKDLPAPLLICFMNLLFSLIPEFLAIGRNPEPSQTIFQPYRSNFQLSKLFLDATHIS